MAKAASPIRLQEDLMQAAAVTGKRFHRSTAEQIEYWAEMGRSVATMLDPDVLLSVTAGLAKIKVEPVYSAPINPDEVFQALEDKRENGTLPRIVTSSAIKYQSSITHPGYLEQIDQNGKITLGKFQQGVFIATTEAII
jgi:ParD-like antitoxin of type II bacterial toxin-antitoxin system